MASLRSRLFKSVLRNRNLFRFQLKRKPEVDWDTSIPELREKTEKASRLFGRIPAKIVVEPESVGERYAEWVLPPSRSKETAILYFHGGGYVLGSPQGHRTHTAKVVGGSGISAFVFDYRLAPEHPFPAALDDSLAAYQWLLEGGLSPSNIVFMGDSAGGGLCLATLLALKEKGLPLPGAALAFSPWTDLDCTGESLVTNAEVDSLTWKDSWTVFSHYYVKDGEPSNPWISPLYGDLSGLPPLLIFVGGDELLRDDSTRFAERAEAAGVDVTLRVGEGMFHCYPVCSPLFPEAREAMEEACGFIQRHLKCQTSVSE